MTVAAMLIKTALRYTIFHAMTCGGDFLSSVLKALRLAFILDHQTLSQILSTFICIQTDFGRYKLNRA